MRGVVVIILVAVILLVLWYMGQGDTTTVPDAPSAPDLPLPDNPEDAVDGVDKLVKKMPPWGWQVVAVILVLVVISSIKKRHPVLFWGLIFITIGVVIGQAWVSNT